MTTIEEREAPAEPPAGASVPSEPRRRERLSAMVSAVVAYLSVPHWWIEIALIYVIYSAYSTVRNSGGHDIPRAFGNGDAIQRLQERMHIAVELPVNRWVHENGIVANLSALEYHTLHWWVTIGVVVWLFWRRPDAYRKASLVLMLTTLMALAGFFLMPTAPPRMYGGFVDIMAQTSGWGWWEGSGSPGPESVTNQFAAMPSLHCGWAIWCGLMIVLFARRAWVRILGVLYPIVTAFVVVGTANHYVLDVVAILLVIAAACAIVYGWASLRRRRGDAASPTGLPV